MIKGINTDHSWLLKDVIYIAASGLFIFGLFLLLIFLFKEISIGYKMLVINSGLIFATVGPLLFYLKTKGITIKEFIKPDIKFKWFLVSFLIAILIVIVGGWASTLLNNLFNLENSVPVIMGKTLSGNLVLDLINLKLIIGILIPISEELYFRGIIFKYLRQKYIFWISAVLSSLIFVVAHFDLSSVPFVFLLGFFSSLVYEKSGSLMPSFLIHIMVNSLAASFLLFFG